MVNPTPLHHDRDEIIRAARVLVAPGGITELRALDATLKGDRYTGTASGYFDSPTALADAVARITTAKGIYIIPNAVDAVLLARAANRIRMVRKADPLTADHDIRRRRWLPIDFDPRRPAGISATDAEHAAARDGAERVRAYLRGLGWPEPILADSGNGWHLNYRIDLPTDDGGIVQRCLTALAAMFDDAALTVDTGNFNPARIWKCYGTMARKGDATPDRPHRLSRMVEAPAELSPVPLALLGALAGPEPAESAKHATGEDRGGGFNLPAWIARHLPDAEGPKPWKGSGEVWTLPVCPFNPDHTGGSAYVGRLPGGAIMAGCHHNSCQQWGWAELRARSEPGAGTQGKAGKAAGPNAAAPVTGDPVIVRLADVKPEPVRWLWPGRIALGKLTLIAGDPGLGKSFLTMDIAARLSRGMSWPDAPGEAIPAGGVVILSAEDDPADTIVPRLIAAGADLNRINLLRAVQSRDANGKRTERGLNLGDDLPALRATIKATEGCRYIVIDPVSAYLGKVESHNNAEVRGVLAPLATLAADMGVAVVCVTHLNKSAGGKALYRAIGSIAFAAAARAVFAVVKDKDDPGRRLFLPTKNNLAADGSGLAYRLGTLPEGDMPVVQWEPDPVSVSADDAMDSDSGEGGGRTERDDAGDWLRDLLAGGPKPVKEVEADAKAAGFTLATLRRAKVALRVVSRKRAFGEGWEWSLPARKSSPDNGEHAREGAQTSEGERLRTDPPENSGNPPKARTSEAVSTFDEDLRSNGRAGGVPTPCRLDHSGRWWRFPGQTEWTCGDCAPPIDPGAVEWWRVPDAGGGWGEVGP